MWPWLRVCARCVDGGRTANARRVPDVDCVRHWNCVIYAINSARGQAHARFSSTVENITRYSWAHPAGCEHPVQAWPSHGCRFATARTPAAANRCHRAVWLFVLKAHHLADLVEQLELRIWNEPLARPGRRCFSNMESHLLQRTLWTMTFARFILPS